MWTSQGPCQPAKVHDAMKVQKNSLLILFLCSSPQNLGIKV